MTISYFKQGINFNTLSKLILCSYVIAGFVIYFSAYYNTENRDLIKYNEQYAKVKKVSAIKMHVR
jgi:hypothetical protein